MHVSMRFESLIGLLYCQNPWCMGKKCDNKERDLNWELSTPWGSGYKRRFDIKDVDITKLRMYLYIVSINKWIRMWLSSHLFSDRCYTSELIEFNFFDGEQFFLDRKLWWNLNNIEWHFSITLCVTKHNNLKLRSLCLCFKYFLTQIQFLSQFLVLDVEITTRIMGGCHYKVDIV